MLKTRSTSILTLDLVSFSPSSFCILLHCIYHTLTKSMLEIVIYLYIK